MLRLTRLRLQNFRNYDQADWVVDDARLVVVTGPNGSGKTNLLEAVSVLVPGRGLRGARGGELARRGGGVAAESWGVAGWFATPHGALAVGTGCEAGSGDRRSFRLDGGTPRHQGDVTARLAMVWLTPQMDVLFLEPASGRRRFLDRLVYALEPGHARQIAAHDAAQSQRARLLAAGAADPAWLAGLEDQIARHAVAAAAARLSLVRRLNQAAVDGDAAGFPPARLVLACPIAERLEQGAALAAEDWLRSALHAARAPDAQSGSARHGAQRADMVLQDAVSGRTAERASTGERKALLIGVVLGHAALIERLRGIAPILLLDEPMVHLDTNRRRRLCEAAQANSAQFLMTGTDRESFAGLHAAARFFEVREGRLQS